MQVKNMVKKSKIWIYILTLVAIALVIAIIFAIYFSKNVSYASENKSSKKLSVEIPITKKDKSKEINIDKIVERAAQTKDGWEGLNDNQLIDLMDYFKELRIAYTDLNNAAISANPTLQYVAMAEDSYINLSNIQKKFIADYINGIKVTSDTTEQQKNNIRKSIILLVQELSNLDNRGNT